MGSLADAYLEVPHLGLLSGCLKRAGGLFGGIIGKGLPWDNGLLRSAMQRSVWYAVVWYTTCPCFRTELVLVVG